MGIWDDGEKRREISPSFEKACLPAGRGGGEGFKD